MNDVYALPIREFSDKELADLQFRINQEEERRRTTKKTKAWEKVKEAIAAYTKEFGEIRAYDYSDQVEFDYTADFSSEGVISTSTTEEDF